MIEQEAHAAVPAEQLHRLLESLPARKQAHAEAFAGALDPRIDGRVVERPEDGGEFDERRRGYQGHDRLALPATEVDGGEQEGRWGVMSGGVVGGAMRGECRLDGRRSPHHDAQPGLRNERQREREQPGLDEAAAAFPADQAMPGGGFARERVVQVGENEPAPSF